MDIYDVEWTRENPARTKSSDWYWSLGILATAGIVVAFFLNNLLFATIIGLSAVVLMMLARAEPPRTMCRLTHRELMVNDSSYPFQEMDAYHIDEKNGELVLRVATNRLLMPVLIVHIPLEHAETIDMLLGSKVPTRHIDETASHRLLEIFGF
jgi:hypothetical protein